MPCTWVDVYAVGVHVPVSGPSRAWACVHTLGGWLRPRMGGGAAGTAPIQLPLGATCRFLYCVWCAGLRMRNGCTSV